MTAKKSEEGQVFYFARTRSMAAVLWNPKTNSATAEFNKMGLFGTTSPKRAALVKGAGYIEVTPEDITERGMDLPVPDESPSANAQPGAPTGYGAPAPATDFVQDEVPVFVQQAETQKRTLR
jgi:hypothetical protein